MIYVCIYILSTALAGAGFTPSTQPNMNGGYLITKTPGAPDNKTFPTDFKDYPGGVDYFDVYHGPIKTLYSQIFWKSIANDIPQEIVERFDGKVMAIVGIEMDQVRRTPAGDVHVPISAAYNHHHDTAVVGKGAHLEKVPRDHPMAKAAGRKYVRLSGGNAWVPVEDAPSAQGFPTSAMFSDGNGGEYRKSFHACAQRESNPQSPGPAGQERDTSHLAAGTPRRSRSSSSRQSRSAARRCRSIHGTATCVQREPNPQPPGPARAAC